MRKVAIFDIDGTIFRSSLLVELVEVLIEKGVFHISVRADYEKEKVRWLDRRGDYDAYIMAVVKVFMRNIKGVSIDDFTDAAKVVVARYRHRTYRMTSELIADLKKKKYFIVAISHSPKGILDLFCKELGFDKVYGKFYELGPTDRFTGKILDEHLILNKANILRRVVEVEKLTLKGSVGVGDTESDASFLELVERPICFNPNMKLWKHAQRNGWEVMVERKDVIYELNKKRVL
jgi:HAD superfamily phosphoserine phosphatase-like hydrolase